jgi:hypothetical protein
MTSIHRPRALLLAALGLALAAAGCKAENQNSLVVVQNQVVDRSMMNCGVPTSATTVSEPSGILDVGVAAALNEGYFVYPLVRNDLIDRSNPMAGIEPHDSILVTGADVQLEGLATSLPASQQMYSLSAFGGTIDPGGTTGVSVEVIQPQVAAQLAALVTGMEPQPPTVTAHFRITGTRAGGDIQSDWVDFPISLCRWCLTGAQPGACPAMPPSASSVKQGACNPAQDLQVSCCTSGSQLLCGPSYPTASM